MQPQSMIDKEHDTLYIPSFEAAIRAFTEISRKLIYFNCVVAPNNLGK
jgi:hypothetical protein